MYLSFDGVTKRFGAVTAVSDVSFHIEQGTFVSLLGPSGCGKTTTLMLLAGFETADAGRITLWGQDLAALPPNRREVGVVFQHYALFPHMTVAQNIAFGLTHGRHKLSRAEVQERVAELLAITDLTALAQRKPAELSAGQEQRVAIARSLAPRPRILCLDEPLSALDALLREKLRLEIRRLQRELNLTVLYVTHDQEEALAISDRVMVMMAGRIVQSGTPWEIYDRPANRLVAGFIGKGSLWDGKIISVGSTIEVQLSGGYTVALPATVWCGEEPPRVGVAASVVLRAERAVVRPQAVTAPEGDELMLPGRLAEVEFLGGALRLHVKGEVGDMAVAMPAVDYAAWRERLHEPVAVAFHPKDARLVPA